MRTRSSMIALLFIAGFFIYNNATAEPQTANKASATVPSTNSSDSNATVNNEKPPATQIISDSKKIKRTQFTTAIVDREPTDNVIMLTNNSGKIYYFTELSDLKGQTITHRWQYQGKPMAEVKFDIKSDRWRVFSSKKIKPDWTGEWSVVLIDENGNSLDVSKLEVVEATSN